MSKFSIIYKFINKNNEVSAFHVNIDEKTLMIMDSDWIQELPEWAKLEHKQCGHCKLKSDTHPYCPIAKGLYRLIENFKGSMSYQTSKILVETPDRSYLKETDIQTGLGALFGLIMATSACPSMHFLKPMARFHLPFSSIEETVFRSLGSYLIENFFKGDINKEKLKQSLIDCYAEVNVVNEKLMERIDPLVRDKSAGDADRNAIVILDTLASILNSELTENFSSLDPIYNRPNS